MRCSACRGSVPTRRDQALDDGFAGVGGRENSRGNLSIRTSTSLALRPMSENSRDATLDRSKVAVPPSQSRCGLGVRETAKHVRPKTTPRLAGVILFSLLCRWTRCKCATSARAVLKCATGRADSASSIASSRASVSGISVSLASQQVTRKNGVWEKADRHRRQSARAARA